MFLDKELFSTVIHYAPLVSIDLIVKNNDGKFLLGKRKNEPAKGYWFVHGGRIYKDETLDEAFLRIVRSEIGLDIKREEANFYGLYEHFYDNNVFNDEFSTHYIVLAHSFQIDTIPDLNTQHEEYKFFTIEEILGNDMVHRYTKDYFK